MKKLFALLMIVSLVFTMTACGTSQPSNPSEPPSASSDGASQAEMSSASEEEIPPEEASAPDVEASSEPVGTNEEQALVTLTIGDTVLEGVLNDSVPAQSLISQLPLTVSLNDSDNDFCGGSLDIEYSESDVTSGYQNGDLVFWTPASNFVIFVSGEENSANTGDLVKLGHITSPQEMLDALEGQIDVTIALKETTNADSPENSTPESSSAEAEIPAESTANTQEGAEEVRIKITVGDTELFADLEDNSTTRALIEQMPMTLSMSDLYGREMCYRYGANALPTDSLRSDGYAVGDIAYWPPRGSLVILYEQNGEQFERQHLGHISEGVEAFATTGDTDVTFEVVME